MSLILMSVGAAICVMLASLVGVFFASKTLGSWVRENLTYLATFSAGVLIILAYHLVEEALGEGESTMLIIGAVFSGIVLLELIHHLLPDTHHHHELQADHHHTRVDGRRVLLSDAVHNITDGFVIVPAFLADWRIGIAATVSIFFHELVQEISEFFVLREAGYSNQKTLILNFISSSTILIGVALALTLASFETLLAILGGLAAGGFLSVVIRDLLPHAISSAKLHGNWSLHAVAAIIGILLMTGIAELTPHEYGDGHEEAQVTNTI